MSANVFSQEAKEEKLNSTLIEWLCKEFPKNINFFLRRQYRSNELIQEWPNQEFYDSKLEADSTVKNICLADLIEENKKNLNENKLLKSKFFKLLAFVLVRIIKKR